jgi:hypothetical protein
VAVAGAADTVISGPRTLAGIAAAILALAGSLAGCGEGGGSSSNSMPASALRAYVARVEPIRLAVNRLLDRADPILSAYADHKLGPQQAQRRMNALEHRFAAYTVQIAAVRPIPAEIRSAARAYAHTFVLEDAYLSALAAVLPDRDFENLPNTQGRQRAAIIGWRTRLHVVAKRFGVRLPHDLEVAGRGEIAPSPTGS